MKILPEKQIKIPIVFATDDNYAIPTCVAMTSILENAKATTFYDFYLLVTSWFSKKSTKFLDSLKNRYINCSINFIDMKSHFYNIKMKIAHITNVTYYRLLLPEILPQCNKCIYLDSDIIVNEDLADLFLTNIDEFYVAGVKAPGYHYPEDGNKAHCKEVGLLSIDQYINAGVLLLNLKRIRLEGLTEKFLQLSKKHFSSQDQDVINLACYNHIKHLPFKFNVMTPRINEPDNKLFKVFDHKEIIEARRSPVIIHYADKIKPWQDSKCVMADYWWKYLNLFVAKKKSLLIRFKLRYIIASLNFKISNIIVFFHSIIHATIRCYHNYGLFYTFWRIRIRLKSIILKNNPETKKGYEYYRNLNPESYTEELKEWYIKRTGKRLNLINPKTYNEKIQWLKLYDSTALKTRLADKYLVRDWVTEKIGEEYLIPLLGMWDKFEDINFNILPEKFVLKANHGCGWNIIVKDKNTLDKIDAKNKFDRWIKINYAFAAGLELHYKDIKPKIIAEKYIENKDGDLYDYKIWCFNDKPKYIQFLAERRTHLKMAFYDTSWTLLPFVYSYPRYEKQVPKPDNLDEMLKLAEKLCQGFYYARIDFYRLDNGILKFGEITFTPLSGICRFDPPAYDSLLGKMITLPNIKVELNLNGK